MEEADKCLLDVGVGDLVCATVADEDIPNLVAACRGRSGMQLPALNGNSLVAS